jgi:hypothetical protein
MHLIYYEINKDADCGAEGDRTPGLDIANVALSQLSYSPKLKQKYILNLFCFQA